MSARTYSTDVQLACPCPECGGREVRITLRKFRNLHRLHSPAHERAVHELVSTRTADDPEGGGTKINNR